MNLKKIILPILILVSIYKNISADPGLRDALSNIVHGRHSHYRYDPYYYEPYYVGYPSRYSGEQDIIERQAALEKREAELRKQKKLTKLRQKELELEKSELNK
ncbi:hypothetical protein M1446_01050 [Candidatus Dependentiae bacterium]|nr:hypothetical protein [Candidatus Dependentiae bacterium]